MAPGAEPVSGTKAIQAIFTADVAQASVKMALTTEDVVGFGDYALETGSFVATSTDGKHLDHGSYHDVPTRKRAAAGRSIATRGTAA